MKQCHSYHKTATNQLKITTEKFKLLHVIGEDISQLLVEKTFPINAIKIDHLNAELREIHDVLFTNKVVKQGLVHVQIFYVNPENVVLHTATDIPFSLSVEIPNFEPTATTEVQNHLLDITPKFLFLSRKPCDGVLIEIKVVAHILTKVSEWVQRDLVTKVELFPKANTATTCFPIH